MVKFLRDTMMQSEIDVLDDFLRLFSESSDCGDEDGRFIEAMRKSVRFFSNKRSKEDLRKEILDCAVKLYAAHIASGMSLTLLFDDVVENAHSMVESVDRFMKENFDEDSFV